MYCIREINLIGMRFLCLLDDYGLCNQFAEVVHGELCKEAAHSASVVKYLGQYRIILSADTASELRQLLIQKRR